MGVKQATADRVRERGAETARGQRFAAEVRCLHCARMLGSWEWVAGAPQGLGTFLPIGGDRRRDLLWRLRCENCGGPAVLTEVEPVRESEAFVWTPMKRGRKAKQQAA